MNKNIILWLSVGVFSYAIFAIAVLNFYPDTPHDMGWKDRQEYNQIQISKIELGTTKKMILELLGSPDITEAKRANNTQWQIMFYRTRYIEDDGMTTQDECTPLLFENNKLVALGNQAYQVFIDG
ncbi:DUF3192 domain-containing protein [Paraglaciecola sp. L3A3]|uniref:DUF3192 domain-containing protein n=1 Tax=Paraglaciecola sp. L3A3 TaxID=2686358 RepID=UPI00131B2AE8|nr:DUF3192 domain-containing protein [Paraglaciecola sp. L3A3]